jgi:hypothetical protein
MRGELEKMEAELQAMRGRSPLVAPGSGAPRALVIAAAGLVILVGVGFVAFFALRAPRPVMVTLPLPPDPSPTVPAVRAPVPVAPAAPIPLEPIVQPPRSTTARWTANVTRAEGGLGITPGTSCAIEATIATSDTNAIVRELSVFCGTKKLYHSKDALNGMAQMDNDAQEKLTAADDKSVFTLSYRDIGSRTGERTQIDLDTTVRQGAVFRETIPRFRVELSVVPTSAATAALAGPDQRLRRAGKIVEVSGTTAVKAGASCVLRAMPNGKGRDCVAEVACGPSVLWPSSAITKCTYENDRPVTVAAEGAKASLAVDGSKLTLKSPTLSATIALDEP